MKRLFIMLFLVLTIVSFFMCYFLIEYLNQSTINKYDRLMERAYSRVNSVVDGEKYKIVPQLNEKTTNDENVIGILEIEKINVRAPISEGTSKQTLKYSVGHFEKSDIWNGNVALASHNRGSYAHYFKDIKNLEIGDKIRYITDYGEREYRVFEKNKILETDWNKVLEKKSQNTITLVTCITNERKYRLCIKAMEI